MDTPLTEASAAASCPNPSDRETLSDDFIDDLLAGLGVDPWCQPETGARLGGEADERVEQAAGQVACAEPAVCAGPATAPDALPVAGRISIEMLQALAGSRGGSCLSEAYLGGRAQLRWRCRAGHEWDATPNNVRHLGSWCAACYGNKPLTIEEMQQIALDRGGQCVSETYANSATNLRWRCSFGHEWDATPNNIKNLGSWCPHCRVNVGEELVRAALEEAFPGELFERTRRESWMGGLELDGYNEKLRLAFEYQGKQHFEHVEHFQRDDGSFEAQRRRDALKVELCDVVPHTAGFTGIRDHVRRELAILGYDIAPAAGTGGEFYDRVRAQGPATARQHERIAAVIRSKGGECLSPQYLGYRVPLRIRCGKGHEFEATPEAVDQPACRGPRFCPECGGTRRQTGDELREKVEACGYQYLGVESRATGDGRARRYITVRCPAGHEFGTMWDNFAPKDGAPKKGCSACHHARLGAGKRLDIGPWATEHGLEITEPFTGIAKPHRWRCQPAGHQFTASVASLRLKKAACTECWLTRFAETNRLERRTEWVDGNGPMTQIEWRCLKCGKEFTASVAGIGRKKKVCPACA